jgi:ADP-heptose:LPS heptosyltransferase
VGQRRHVIVLRFSALGDVALLAPVLRSAVEHNPEVDITLVTRPKFTELFKSQSSLKTFGADVSNEFAGLFGLWRLFRTIQALHPDVVIDAHDHLRTKILRFFFFWTNVRVVVFDKGRREKKSIIQQKDKTKVLPLRHTTERYREAFVRAGLSVPSISLPPLKKLSSESSVESALRSISNKRWIGVAPFAAHFTKLWPLKRFEEVIQELKTESEVMFLLFGGGKKEKELLDRISSRHTNSVNLTGIFSLDEELSVISKLEAMVCVDSANMHLAALSGVPIISIWGGTHVMTGFGPFPNPDHHIVEIPTEQLSCRPCSVYGLERCPRRDHACMQEIDSERVISAVREVLNKNSVKS